MSPTPHERQRIRHGLTSSRSSKEPGWEATEDQPGILYVPVTLKDQRAVKLLELVSKTKALVDVLIVSAHWGPNWGDDPPAKQIPFAHALVDAGADVIFGHSGHVVRGIELYREKPILYCTGDFVDDYAVDELERNDQSFIFVVEMVGQQAVIVDDILDTGGTLVSCCEQLQQRGVRDITILITHGLFTGMLWQKLWTLGVKRIYCTDTVPPAQERPVENISTLSVLPLLCQHLEARK